MKLYLSRPKESLIEHIERVMNSYNNLNTTKNIDSVFEGMVNKLCVEEKIDFEYKPLLLKMIKDVFYLHDEGKKSKYFQVYIGNSEYKNVKYNKESKQHSIVSSYYYIEKYIAEIGDLNLKGRVGRKIKGKLQEIVIRFSYIISCHHGALGDFDKGYFIEKLENFEEDYPEAFFDGFDKSVIKVLRDSSSTFDGTTIYFLSKYIYSVLVTCDFMAVHEFKKGCQLRINTIDDAIKTRFKGRLEATKIVEGIRKYSRKEIVISGVNKYRCDMFLDSEKNLTKEKRYKIFYLEAPTGAGKSVTSLNLALNLIDNINNKIIYVAPFTNVIEQTYKDVCQFIGEKDKDVVKISAKDEIVTQSDNLIENTLNLSDDNEELLVTDYDIDYMDNLLINYPFTVVSHVRLFNMLFGVKRKEAMTLTLLANSVVILDEIQSYKNKIWIPIINYLKKYSDLLNIKIIIMSATLPKLDELLEESGGIGSLIDNRDYYFDFFKKRVDCDFTILDKSKDIDDKEELKNILLRKIDSVIEEKDSRILIGSITRKTCNDLYTTLKEIYIDTDYEIYKIEGITSVAKKNKIISRLKQKDASDDSKYEAKKVILVATQCIEAGVDIDMNIGFKNISTIDSDEQFMGRIERNFKNKGLVYFYKIDDVGKIYKDDYRANKTLVDEKNRYILETKKFDELYKDTYKWLIENEYKNYEEIKKNTSELKLKSVYKELKLIDDDSKVNLLMMCKFKCEDGQIIDVEELITEYQKIKSNTIMGYGEKEIKLSKLKKHFDKFTYVVNIFDFEKVETAREFGIYKLIEGAEKYYDKLDNECITNDSEVMLEKLTDTDIFIE